jgi:hypothetical protein
MLLDGIFERIEVTDSGVPFLAILHTERIKFAVVRFEPFAIFFLAETYSDLMLSIVEIY